LETTIKASSKSVWAVGYNGRNELATGSTDGSVKLWNADANTCSFDLKGHVGSVRCVAFSRNSLYLATGASDKTIKIWNTETGALVKTLIGFSSRVVCVSFDRVNKLASRLEDGTVRLWNI
jgi:WD40 repeat protein